jgi:quercetin dioxygenase-like cupin family protein
MYVIEQARPEPTEIPGVAHATWAGSSDGLKQLSLWRQTLAPGGATPPHTHDCDEIVLCQAGLGEVHIDGKAYRFGPNSTVVLPKGIAHQLFNVGTTPMETVGVFGGTPVGTFLPEGEELALPWRT